MVTLGRPTFITGDSANCIHTFVGYIRSFGGYDETPWWQVDLGRVYPVHDITVWGRGGQTHRLYPFTITVDGQQCARAVSGGRQHSVTCATVINGRVVRLARDYRSDWDFSLNMCELEVWVCQSGYHRVSNRTCELCNTNCDRGCYRGNGRCDGCKPGYHGDQCDSQCSTIHYRCTQCTQDSTCTTCSSNFQAPACTGCKDGRWGAQCGTPCHGTCGQCTQDTGSCTACSGFFKLPECKECLEGYYKQSWSTSCTECTWQCLDNTVCSNTTGDCADCPPGKMGDRCQQGSCIIDI
ncbi:hypothetical protein V1264_024869 [Littorina saxatilis]|uniref:EGF-like domain-containing protein n=2 Tax=Littorina saxatilis TaxID=31220 RepID=A0AAN9AM99_9CAEN